LFESVSLCDELVVTAAEADEVVCEGVEGPNLVADALAGLRARGWGAPPVRVEIEKRIPVAGGMGGGSADAAALLRLAPRLAPVRPEDVAALAAELGSDVPAQLTPGLSLGSGAGEQVSPLAPLPQHSFVIVPLTGQRLSTAAVYAEADRLGLPRAGEELEALRLELDRALAPGGPLPPSLLVNDLEPAARALCPAIGEALLAVSDAGADHAFVCGSGPTVAGMFWGERGAERARDAAERLVRRFPGAVAVAPVSSRA